VIFEAMARLESSLRAKLQVIFIAGNDRLAGTVVSESRASRRLARGIFSQYDILWSGGRRPARRVGGRTERRSLTDGMSAINQHRKVDESPAPQTVRSFRSTKS